MTNKNRKKIVLYTALALALALGVGAGVYLGDFYRAQGDVNAALEAGLADGSIVDEGKWLSLPAQESTTGLILYPGAKVEYTSYLFLADKLRDSGIHTYLVRMPANLALLDADRADAVIAAHPEIETWMLAGHSLGGAFGSSYAASNADISAVFLLGAYLYGDYPAEQTLTIYGSNDLVLDRSKLTYAGEMCVLDGGNHAGFGHYGAQQGDGAASLSQHEQQELAVEAILRFLEEKSIG